MANESMYEPGTILSYRCNEEYASRDDLITTCGDDFQWSLDSEPPACLRSKFVHFNQHY